MKVKSHYLYDTYHNILARCNNKNRWNYQFYGGKGISVCERWMEKKTGFLNFLEDMGDRKEGYQIDRIDNNGNYSPENCRWVNKYVQMGNTSTNNKTPGVGWHKQRSKFRARIKVNGTDISLGLFNNYDDAVLARKNAEKTICTK